MSRHHLASGLTAFDQFRSIQRKTPRAWVDFCRVNADWSCRLLRASTRREH
jgi:hypothetical protein